MKNIKIRTIVEVITTVAIAFVFAALLTSCGVTLPLTPAAMNLQAAPWTAPPPPDLSESLVTARQSCAHQVEELREQALAAAKWRDSRRILVAVAGGAATGAGVIMAATSEAADTAQAISGYVLAGAGLFANAIDAIVPLKRYEAIHGAWQKAFDLLATADGKLRDLHTCMALDSPSLDKTCQALPVAVTSLNVKAATAAPSPAPAPASQPTASAISAADAARQKLIDAGGLAVIRSILAAYQTCASSTPTDY